MNQPFAWFLHSPALAPILPKEAADNEGQFKNAGDGDRHRSQDARALRAQRASDLRPNPHYFQPGLPYVDAIEARIDTDPASKLAPGSVVSTYFAPEIHMTVQRTDLDVVQRRSRISR
jgi:hypothetical protein